ncbi:hypothetical protein LTS08_006022 [Lithohypha guttulata]|uniref:uncharacterized protein n=1 Tax=Lithohypha guttulata TaxID=1690604 RepID=UPI002DDE661C|nr:hypothetical protein LTR51_002536 [Lithohypha guttulata]KAK5099440.1 hypothetical protein LTS08_006022 [Lithohypha guttulata]
MTKEQIKTSELQKTPHTPNQIVTEVPHSKDASIILDVPSPLWYHRLGPMKNFLGWFSRMQRRRPLTTTLATSLTTYLCGDLLAQEIGREPYDGKRTLRMLTVGAVASIPGYKWFLFLGSHFNYGSTAVSITIKVLIQQFFFAPLFNSYFFGMQAFLAGATLPQIIERLKGAVPESVISSAKFWPAVTALNFTVIPAHLRFAFSGVFAVVWQTYLSFLNRKEERVEPMGTLVQEAKVRVDQIVEDITESSKE